MKNTTNLITYISRKKMLATAMSLAIAFSAGSLFAGTHATSASAKTVATDVTNATEAVVKADDIAATGKQFLGTRYLFGAASNRTDAFDCSSLMQYIFKKNGIDLPRSSRDQAKVGEYVAKSDLQPGDLVFSDTNKDGKINHVSLYIGDGKLLHTYRVGIGVTISDFEGSTWDRTYVTARRVLKDDTGNVTAPDETESDNAPSDSEDGLADVGNE